MGLLVHDPDHVLHCIAISKCCRSPVSTPFIPMGHRFALRNSLTALAVGNTVVETAGQRPYEDRQPPSSRCIMTDKLFSIKIKRLNSGISWDD